MTGAETDQSRQRCVRNRKRSEILDETIRSTAAARRRKDPQWIGPNAMLMADGIEMRRV